MFIIIDIDIVFEVHRDPVTRYNGLKLTGKRVHTDTAKYWCIEKVVENCNEVPNIVSKTVDSFTKRVAY